MTTDREAEATEAANETGAETETVARAVAVTVLTAAETK